MGRTALAALLLSCALAAPPGAAAQKRSLPALLRLMFSPIPGGAWVRMPVLDFDPNRGPTYGLMQVRVAESSSTIRSIHAWRASFNRSFGPGAQYEHYGFPSDHAVIYAGAGLSLRVERGAAARYETTSLAGSAVGLGAGARYARDSAGRFYGFGPASSRADQSNYTLDSVAYELEATLPFSPTSPFQAELAHALRAAKVLDGAIEGIPDLAERHPGVAEAARRRLADGVARAGLRYDSRDDAETTTRGAFARVFVEGSSELSFSDFRYARYGAEARGFKPWVPYGAEPRFVTAALVRAEQVDGRAPFWALPGVGGKYSHRAYGEGRFVDRGAAVASLEQRCRLARLPIAKLVTSFWLDPFVTVGEVFPDPARAQARRTVAGYGFALRAVGRPHVVGSADFGFGREGLSVFLDINYAF